MVVPLKKKVQKSAISNKILEFSDHISAPRQKFALI